jgi:hypothetical protein
MITISQNSNLFFDEMFEWLSVFLTVFCRFAFVKTRRLFVETVRLFVKSATNIF